MKRLLLLSSLLLYNCSGPTVTVERNEALDTCNVRKTVCADTSEEAYQGAVRSLYDWTRFKGMSTDISDCPIDVEERNGETCVTVYGTSRSH